MIVYRAAHRLVEEHVHSLITIETERLERDCAIAVALTPPGHQWKLEVITLAVDHLDTDLADIIGHVACSTKFVEPLHKGVH